MMSLDSITDKIKALAGERGFAACGIARAERLNIEAERLRQWLDRGYNGGMTYMARHADLRIDPNELLPRAKSVISLAYNYFPGQLPSNRSKFVISKYALGRDYHKVIRGKLKRMIKGIEEIIPGVGVRACVDSAPIMEKTWAVRSGLGWLGKNGNIINRQKGSFFFLSELIVDAELGYDSPATDHCGSCRACLDACPTGAIVEPYVVDASRCISYLTIEHKGSLPTDMEKSYRGWIFGCDICQDVCPFNRFAAPHNEPDFGPRQEIFTKTNRQWRELTQDEFDTLFNGSAVKRTGFEGLVRNIDFVDE